MLLSLDHYFIVIETNGEDFLKCTSIGWIITKIEEKVFLHTMSVRRNTLAKETTVEISSIPSIQASVYLNNIKVRDNEEVSN